MMNIFTFLLGAFLAGAVTPLAKRVIVGLGLGIITFAGAGEALGMMSGAIVVTGNVKLTHLGQNCRF